MNLFYVVSMTFTICCNRKGYILKWMHNRPLLLFQYLELQCTGTDFFAVKTLRFTCLSIKLLFNTITTQIQELYMIANLVLRMATKGDKSKSESGI